MFIVPFRRNFIQIVHPLAWNFHDDRCVRDFYRQRVFTTSRLLFNILPLQARDHDAQLFAVGIIGKKLMLICIDKKSWDIYYI